ncbi:PhzA/PhzB family protein [Flexivirga meconopsidis]|uniref:PhzA/PhzB family protein n=1 Tax=Flexivirga meconopsidis TaxID=2977121 RepID=UPI00223E9A89|nr:PhzA/PhzB family protein [Flexivirga meconopsidis]
MKPGLELIDAYLDVSHEARLNRYQLYDENGSASLWFTDRGKPITVRGRGDLRKHNELSIQVLPDWQWHDVEIHLDDNGRTAWVECTGEGTILFPSYPRGHYRNNFVHRFEFWDGLIVSTREYTNPLEHMRALGIAIPQIRRDWIPEA